MEKEKITEQIERWKATAEIFLHKDIKAFIKDINDNIYFAKILLVGEDSLRIQCFGPKQRAGQKYTLYWPLITDFSLYQEEVKV